MSLSDDVQILALHDVLADTGEYRLRYIMRWYSKTFYTPLDRVPTIPLANILTAFFETRYEGMDAEDREEERLKLVETDAERLARIYREEKEAMANEDLLAELGKESVNKGKEIKDLKIPDQQIPVKTRERVPELNLPGDKLPTELPENISIRFAAPNFFDDLEADLDSAGSDLES